MQPKRNGLEVLTALKQSDSLSPTLILTTFDEDKFIIGGLRAGAKGYLLKDVSLDQLTSAIRTLAGGGTLVHPAITQRLLNNLDRIQCDFPSTDTPVALSAREVEILRLVARGSTTAKSLTGSQWRKERSKTTSRASFLRWTLGTERRQC